MSRRALPKVMFVTNIQIAGGGEEVLYELAGEFGDVVLAPAGDVSVGLQHRHIPWRRLRATGELRRATNPIWVIELIGRAVGGWLEIGWKIITERPTIVHVNNLAAGIYALPPALILRKRRIWHVHDVVPVASLEAFVVRWLQYLTNTIIVPSQASRDSLSAIGVALNKVVIVPSGIDVQVSFNPDVVPRSDLRERLGIAPGAWVIAVVGHVAPNKGIHLLADAIDMLPDKVRRDLHVLVVGTAPPRWRRYELDLRRRVAHGGKFHFLGRSQEIPRVLKAVDILVQASLYPEAFGRAVAEAMAMRKVVIVSDAGALPALVDDGIDGYVFRAGDARHLQTKLQLAIDSKPKSDELTASARQKALSELDWRVSSDLVRAIYRMP